MNLAAALKEIKSQSEFMSRATIESWQVSILGSKLVEVAGHGRFNLNPNAQHRLVKWLGLPASFDAKRLGPKLFGEVMNRLWNIGVAEKQIPSKLRLLSKGNEVVGFDNPELITLNSGDVVNVLIDCLPKSDVSSFKVRSLVCTDDGFSLHISSPRISREVRVGDVVEAGVAIRHSQVGAHATQVYSFLHRLACANGVLVRVCNKDHSLRIRRLEVGKFDEEAQLQRLSLLVEQAYNDLEANLQALADLAEKPVDAKAMIEELCRRHGFSKKLREQLIEALRADELENDASTEFDVVQSFSRLVTHGDIRPSVRDRLATLTGALSRRGSHQCPVCQSVQAG